MVIFTTAVEAMPPCSNEVESTTAVEASPHSPQRMFIAMEKSENVTSAS